MNLQQELASEIMRDIVTKTGMIKYKLGEHDMCRIVRDNPDSAEETTFGPCTIVVIRK